MNIYINNEEIFEQLKQASLVKVLIGSHMYGLNNENSDIDYLYIYATSHNELLTPFQTHHQLQFKENRIDHNFVSLHTFLINLLKGDSTINFEVIHSNALNNTELEFLNIFKNDFITYTIIRSYLGFCKRDVKQYYKMETEYLKNKRLSHIIRGVKYAKEMILNQFNFEKCNNELYSILKKIDINCVNLKEFDIEISQLREELNFKLNNKTLGYAQYFDVKRAKLLSEFLTKYCLSESFCKKQSILNNFDITCYLEAYENWVEY